MPMAAIYARVSSDQQREAHTIASQTAALIELAQTLALDVPKAWIFEDEGFSGATLERPGLERVRDLAAEGQIQTVLVYSAGRGDGQGGSDADLAQLTKLDVRSKKIVNGCGPAFLKTFAELKNQLA